MPCLIKYNYITISLAPLLKKKMQLAWESAEFLRLSSLLLHTSSWSYFIFSHESNDHPFASCYQNSFLSLMHISKGLLDTQVYPDTKINIKWSTPAVSTLRLTGQIQPKFCFCKSNIIVMQPCLFVFGLSLTTFAL